MVALIVIMLLVLIAIRVPIGISMGVTAVTYFIIEGIPLASIVQKAFGGVNSFEMTAIPLFMLAGELMNNGGISGRLINFSNALLGHIKGGLGLGTVLTSMIFGGASGSSMAEVAAIGPITIPAMKKQGYNPEFAAAIVGVSAELGPIIPPSIVMVIAASLSHVSVGKMLLSGLIPGVMIAAGLMIVVYVISRIKNYPNEKQPDFNFRKLLQEFKESFWALMMPFILIGGMVSGIFTPTEAAGVAILYGLFVGVLIYKELKWQDIINVCRNSVVSSAGIMFVVAMASLYSYMLTNERIGETVANFLISFAHSPLLVFLVLILALIPLGMLLSTTPVIMLVIPVLVPLSNQLAIDPIQFFSVVTLAAMLGTLTPPVALSLYLTSQIAQTKPEKTFVAMLPLIAVIYLVVALAVFFPEITTWIPNLAYK